MRAANPIAAWAPQRAFLVAEPDRETMRITPVSVNPVRLPSATGAADCRQAHAGIPAP
jgi:hypothetical protein